MIYRIAAGIICYFAFAATQASAQQVERGVTVWKSLDQVHWGAIPGRMALLVGNSTYSDNTAAHGLDNLPTPCGDARLVASALVVAGWKPQEIAVACDQTADQITRAINHLTTALPRRDDRQQLSFVYLSGHGVSVGQRNYMFGVGAVPDIDKAVNDVLNQSDGELFSESAINVITSFANQTGSDARSSVLLVVDTCRNDPLFTEVRGRLMDRARGSRGRSEASITAEAKGLIDAPKGISGPNGMRILYATGQERTVPAENGVNGHGRLAVALDHAIRRFVRAEAVVSASAREVAEDTKGLGSEYQPPEAPGWFLNDPCIGQCRPTEERPEAARRAASLLSFASYLVGSDMPAGAAQSAPERASFQLLESETTDPKKFTVEVFWCEVGAQSDTLRRQAFTFGGRVAGLARAGNAGFSDIARVRVTQLSSAENSRSGRQFNDNRVVVDPRAGSVGAALGGLDSTLAVEELSSQGPRYVGAYFCRDSYHGASNATVYLQAPADGGLKPALAVIAGLVSDRPDLNTIRQVDTRPKAFPRRTEVRFYDKDQEKTAMGIRDEVQRIIGVEPRTKYMTALARDPFRKQIEIWISVSDVSKANLYLNRLTETKKGIAR